jgi:hypothetical protein
MQLEMPQFLGGELLALAPSGETPDPGKLMGRLFKFIKKLSIIATYLSCRSPGRPALVRSFEEDLCRVHQGQVFNDSANRGAARKFRAYPATGET